MAFDAADLAHADGRVDARNIGAGGGDHDGDARPRVRRAADDLGGAVRGIDLTDLQLVGVGVLFGTDDLADGEPGKLCTRIFNPFDLEAEVGQRIGDLVQRGGGLEVRLEPAQGEFHRVCSGSADNSAGGSCLCRVRVADRCGRGKMARGAPPAPVPGREAEAQQLPP